MKFLFFLFFLILILPFSLAVSLSGSPSSLNFNLRQGQEECQNISIFSDSYRGSLYSVIKWADKDYAPRSPGEMNLTSDEISLNIINSPEKINNFNGEAQAEVCISGEEIGNWRGSLEYRTEGGGIAVGVGVWLRVNITEPLPGENFAPKATAKNSNETTIPETINENKNLNENAEAAGITGAVVGTNSNRTIGLIIAIIIVIAGIILMLYKKFRGKKCGGYYYLHY